MTNEKIITTWKIQSRITEVSDDLFFKSLKVKIERSHIIQVLEHLGHCDNIIENTDRRLEWYKLNTWSDLVSMMDCALCLKTDSYLNTIY